MEIAVAAEEFLKEVSRLNRAEATGKKYKLTLDRLSTWCRTQPAAVFSLSQLDVPTLRRWIHSWPEAPTTRHNQHQRIIAFFNFCIEQGWIKENPARRIKKVPRQQDETLSFSREQFDALIEATHYYDGRGAKRRDHEFASGPRIPQALALERSSRRRRCLPCKRQAARRRLPRPLSGEGTEQGQPSSLRIAPSRNSRGTQGCTSIHFHPSRPFLLERAEQAKERSLQLDQSMDNHDQPTFICFGTLSPSSICWQECRLRRCHACWGIRTCLSLRNTTLPGSCSGNSASRRVNEPPGPSWESHRNLQFNKRLPRKSAI